MLEREAVSKWPVCCTTWLYHLAGNFRGLVGTEHLVEKLSWNAIPAFIQVGVISQKFSQEKFHGWSFNHEFVKALSLESFLQ